MRSHSSTYRETCEISKHVVRSSPDKLYHMAFAGRVPPSHWPDANETPLNGASSRFRAAVIASARPAYVHDPTASIWTSAYMRWTHDHRRCCLSLFPWRSFAKQTAVQIAHLVGLHWQYPHVYPTLQWPKCTTLNILDGWRDHAGGRRVSWNGPRLIRFERFVFISARHFRRTYQRNVLAANVRCSIPWNRRGRAILIPPSS